MTIAERRAPYVSAWGSTENGRVHKDEYTKGEMREEGVEMEERGGMRKGADGGGGGKKRNRDSRR